MSDAPCPFCAPEEARVFLRTAEVVGLWDGFPVSPGHALLVLRRHVASWFEASRDERASLLDAIDQARREIERRHTPDGFNIGVNVGDAAGQTIDHLHVHLIPRYRGDVTDPRGGVRHVIPGRGNYLADGIVHDESPEYGLEAPLPGIVAPPHSRALVRGDADPLLPHLAAHLATADRADIAIAFLTIGGLALVEEHLRDLLSRGGRLRIVTGDYLGFTEPAALRRLLDLEGKVERRIFETEPPSGHEDSTAGRTFHPKGYIVHDRAGSGVAFVGSSNLTRAALREGVEWNYRTTSLRDRQGFAAVTGSFEDLLRHPATRELTEEWIDAYQRRRATPAPMPTRPVDVELEPPPPPPTPHEIQRAALAKLEETRGAGNQAGLVVLATGLGKTWLAAFDSDRPGFERVLFVAHREEILAQAMRTFRQIRPDAHLGHYTGAEKDPTADVLFASIQTIGRKEHLESFARDEFAYVVVDEFHHAAARSYRRLIDYLKPKFLLGLTATPERTDGDDLLGLCGENLVYRCDLFEGIEKEQLAPFHYFGVPDVVDYRNIPWRSTRFDEEELTRAVATRTRAQNALEQHRRLGGRRTLGFCVSQRHADFVADYFHEHGVRCAAVHSGPTSAPRALSLEQLEAGDLDVVFAVDMFNEGVDLPDLDTVMMLRPTESKIVWLQQLGRGLRRSAGKDHLRVIDYIGNHRVFLLKAQTLLGLPPGDDAILLALKRAQARELDLPPGCEVTYDLEAIEIMKQLLRARVRGEEALRRYYEEFRERTGSRPRAVEAWHDDPANLRSAGRAKGSWLRFVRAMGDLSSDEQIAIDGHGDFLDELEKTPMTKSYKMIVLEALLRLDRFPGEIRIDELTSEFAAVANRSAELRKDVGADLRRANTLRALIEKNPIKAWVDGKGTGGNSYFAYAGGVLRTTFRCPPEIRGALRDLTREIVEWRLAEYLARGGSASNGRGV